MGLSVIIPPAALPVTVEEAKQDLRIFHTDEDAKIERMITAATAHVEHVLDMSLMERTLKLTLDAFSDWIELSRGPVTQVVSVNYFDEAGASQVAAADLYTVDLTSTRQGIVLNSAAAWPTTMSGVNAVSVTYKAGYPVFPERLDDIKAAILTLVRHQFDTPAGNIPPMVDMLLQPHRPMLV